MNATTMKPRMLMALTLGALLAACSPIGAQAAPDFPPLSDPTDMCGGHAVTISADEKGDKIVGTEGDDVIVTKDGKNRIESLGGDDIICTGSDADVIDGGAGRDLIEAYGGNDRIDGGRGSDWVRASNGNDDVAGGSGDDLLDGEQEFEVISDYGTSNDRIAGGPGEDLLIGGPGQDRLNGGQARDVCDGDDGGSPSQTGDSARRCEKVVGVP